MSVCKVLKALTLSTDGINVKDYAEGDEVDVPDRLIAGLRDGGFLKPQAGWKPPEPKPSPVVVPHRVMTPPAGGAVGSATQAPAWFTEFAEFHAGQMKALGDRIAALEAKASPDPAPAAPAGQDAKAA